MDLFHFEKLFRKLPKSSGPNKLEPALLRDKNTFISILAWYVYVDDLQLGGPRIVGFKNNQNQPPRNQDEDIPNLRRAMNTTSVSMVSNLSKFDEPAIP